MSTLQWDRTSTEQYLRERITINILSWQNVLFYLAFSCWQRTYIQYNIVVIVQQWLDHIIQRINHSGANRMVTWPYSRIVMIINPKKISIWFVQIKSIDKIRTKQKHCPIVRHDLFCNISSSTLSTNSGRRKKTTTTTEEHL